MNATIEAKRRPLPSISTVYGPVEEYWGASRLADLPAEDPREALDPLDAFLVHRLLELVPGHPVLIDAALATTGGASSLIGMHNPRVRGVWAVVDPESLPSRRALATLQANAGTRCPGVAPLEFVERAELTGGLADQSGAVILADARAGDPAYLAAEIGRWLDVRPDALVLVLGIGDVGDCPAVAALMTLCSPASGYRLRLMRELSEVLMSSRLGVVARRDHTGLARALERLEQFYTGNYRYLDLLWRANHAALREARIDADVLRSHPTFGAISDELDGLRQAVREANERADAAAAALALLEAQVAQPPGPLVRLCRRLSPTPIGGAWRMAKRARVKLSPTPIGKAYRMTKRVALACMPRGL
jgi:hypothetical protein